MSLEVVARCESCTAVKAYRVAPGESVAAPLGWWVVRSWRGHEERPRSLHTAHSTHCLRELLPVVTEKHIGSSFRIEVEYVS